MNSTAGSGAGSGQPAVLKTSSIHDGRFFPEESKAIARRDLNRARVSPVADSIVISRMNTPDLVGDCGFVSADYANLFLPDRLWMAKTKNSVSARWLAYLLSSDQYRQRLRLAATGTSGSMKNISRRALGDIEIPLPPMKKQTAVATALADMDALIEVLNRLIQKKLDMKAGASQQLLTQRERLPDFTANWRHGKLKDVLNVRHGKSQKGITVSNGRYPILATGGEIGRTNTPLYERPSVLIGRKGTIDSPQYRDQPFWSVDTLFYTDIHSADAEYIFYVFNTIDWRALNEASGVPSLSAARIEQLPVWLPDRDEQRAIAQVLSDMDAEIEALEARLEKMRGVKRGMMQELFSRQMRPAPEGVAA